MQLSSDEKKYLVFLVKRELAELKKIANATTREDLHTLFLASRKDLLHEDLNFLKAEHRVEDFLQDLLKKLGGKK
ncbi:hypothetical protein HY484_04595 [Candidatus Woesearchaeota archaeon]|nr:hypothetical protein [Candidatus Woesearchaeota archaeon]